MNTTEQAKRIEMTYLRKSKLLHCRTSTTLRWNNRGTPSGQIDMRLDTLEDTPDPHIDLDYKVRPHGTDEWKPMDYRVKMESTLCRYGGRRWWFICPNTRCGRRNSILYSSGDYFVCRKCAQLKYTSQEYSGKYRILHNLFGIEDYERTMKRWFYRGKPTRKHRRLIKMRRGMTEDEMLNACLTMMKA
jgi:hypothetical protein